jgi:hypothetical protein
VQAVRDRTHWKSQEIRPRDPVLLGLCSQTELDDTIMRTRPNTLPGEGPQPVVRAPLEYEEPVEA